MFVIVQGTYLAWMPSINKKCHQKLSYGLWQADYKGMATVNGASTFIGLTLSRANIPVSEIICSYLRSKQFSKFFSVPKFQTETSTSHFAIRKYLQCWGMRWGTALTTNNNLKFGTITLIHRYIKTLSRYYLSSVTSYLTRIANHTISCIKLFYMVGLEKFEISQCCIIASRLSKHRCFSYGFFGALILFALLMRLSNASWL